MSNDSDQLGIRGGHGFQDQILCHLRSGRDFYSIKSIATLAIAVGVYTPEQVEVERVDYLNQNGGVQVDFGELNHLQKKGFVCAYVYEED